MFSTLRTRFGIPGVISVIALVFAMLGGAYAASNSGGGKNATASAKAKKGPRGPRGPQGPAGPAGPQGPAGPAGKDGANGLNGLDGEAGKNGTNGTNGKNGSSVENTVEPDGANCTEGGSKFVVGTGTPTYACNGEDGEDGEDGETGFTATLPSGETETGAWAVGGVPAVTCTVEGAGECTGTAKTAFGASIYSPISFTIPLAANLPDANLHRVKEGEGSAPAACDGTPENPTADPGNLCVYTEAEVFQGEFASIFVGPAAANGLESTTKFGAVIGLSAAETGTFAYGTWAVTAP